MNDGAYLRNMEATLESCLLNIGVGLCGRLGRLHAAWWLVDCSCDGMTQGHHFEHELLYDTLPKTNDAF